MGFTVFGMLKGKQFKSRVYATEQLALRRGYALTYNKSGNTKRKSPLYNWEVRRVR